MSGQHDSSIKMHFKYINSMNTFSLQIILIGPFFKEICAEIWCTKGAPRWERVKPTAPDQGLKDVTRLHNLLHYSNTIVWDKLTGGGTVVSLQKISKNILGYTIM